MVLSVPPLYLLPIEHFMKACYGFKVCILPQIHTLKP